MAAALLLAISALSATHHWLDVEPNEVPRARAGAMAAYDVVGDRWVVFGGITLLGVAADSWSYTDASWQRLDTLGPTARTYGGLIYDDDQEALLLFGGADGSGDISATLFGDTWSLHDDTWEIQSTSGPSARELFAFAYDSHRHQAVLFGGLDDQGPSAETWLWLDGVWQWVDASGPSARTGAAMTFDAVRGELVLFGGHLGALYYDDTWLFDGATWRPAAPSERPTARAMHAFFYDSHRERALLVGGVSNYYTGTVELHRDLADTWEWDGSDWRALDVDGKLPARRLAATGYDSGRRRGLLFGGLTGNELRADTWELASERSHLSCAQVANPTAAIFVCVGWVFWFKRRHQ